MFKNYLTVAIRNLKRQKLYAFINIFGLALGIACCILMTLFVKHEWSHDRFHKNDIYRLITHETTPNGETKHKPLFQHTVVEDLKNNVPGVAKASAYLVSNAVIQHKNKRFYEPVGLISPDFLSIFSFPLKSGNPITALNRPNNIVISASLAQKLFENTTSNQLLGQTLTIPGKTPEQNQQVTITGILEDLPKQSSLQFQMLMSIEQYQNFGRTLDDGGYASIYIQLTQNQVPQQLNTPLTAFAQTHLTKRIQKLIGWKNIPNEAAFALTLQPLTDIYRNPNIPSAYESKGSMSAVYILLTIATLILIIACSNFTTLSIAHSAGRSLEIGMRKVLGAQRQQVMQQFWSEALILSIIGLLLGLALAELFLPTFNSFILRDLSIAYFDSFFLLLLLVLIIIIGSLAGSYPATVLSRFQPISALKGEAQIGGRNRLTRTLIVLQYTISITLIICTGVLIQQQKFIFHKNLGYDQEHVLTVGVKNRQQADLYKQELLKDSDVSHVSITDRAFVSGSAALTCEMPDGSTIDVRTIAIDPDFLPTLNISLLQGRNFSVKQSTDRKQAILINKSLAQKLNLNNPIGYVFSGFKLGNITPTIVGIVDDFHIDALHNPIQPLVLQMDVFLTNPKLLIRIRPNHLPETIARIEKMMQTTVPGDPIKLTFLNERLQQQYLTEKHWQKILTYSAIFTVLISCLGLLGLATFTVLRRTKEIGIRKVLGASIPNLVNLLTIDFIKLLIVANIIAWPIAYYTMDKWLTNFAYHINLGIGIFALSGALALIVALLTVGTQTFKAARNNPIDALRYE